MAKTFREIVAWQKAHELVIATYRITQKFPDNEKFGLISQMRRAAVSIPSNIVEGFKRNGFKESLHFFNISESSLEELKYQTLLSLDLNYINQQEHENFFQAQEQVGRLIKSWMRHYQ